MAISGNLADFSLPELFQFLEQGHKTGLLTIDGQLELESRKPSVHHIWLHQGRVIAAADRLDQKGLVSMIAQRGWVSDRVIYRVAQICPIHTPMGLCLKAQGLLQPEQLKLLFSVQVLRQVCALFQLKDGRFTFNPIGALPLTEMTGLSINATEATLMSLRALRDWRVLSDQLPDPTSGLSSTIGGQPQMRLDAQEWQVWEFVNGNLSLHAIATAIRLPVEKVQQIAFRLIVVGLAEEYFMIATTPTSTVENPTPLVADLVELKPQQPANKPVVSQSFLQNLVGFLRSKT